jgi:hypothetical protein
MFALPGGSGFFIAKVPIGPNRSDPVGWNPWNKVVHDHRHGAILHGRTNDARSKRGLPTPWTPDIADVEVTQPPVA